MVGVGLLGRAAVQNYDLLFEQYGGQYMRSVWNTQQIGEVVAQFASTIGSPDTAYVIPYPYWVESG